MARWSGAQIYADKLGQHPFEYGVHNFGVIACGQNKIEVVWGHKNIRLSLAIKRYGSLWTLKYAAASGSKIYCVLWTVIYTEHLYIHQINLVDLWN